MAAVLFAAVVGVVRCCALLFLSVCLFRSVSVCFFARSFGCCLYFVFRPLSDDARCGAVLVCAFARSVCLRQGLCENVRAPSFLSQAVTENAFVTSAIPRTHDRKQSNKTTRRCAQLNSTSRKTNALHFKRPLSEEVVLRDAWCLPSATCPGPSSRKERANQTAQHRHNATIHTQGQ